MRYINPKTSFGEYPHDGMILDTENPLDGQNVLDL